MENIISLDQEYVAGTYGRFPVALVQGKGSIAKDPEDKEYIDLGSGIGTTAFGYADETWVNAVTTQLANLQHTSNLYYTQPCAQLAQALCKKTGMRKVFFQTPVQKPTSAPSKWPENTPPKRKAKTAAILSR